MSRFWPIREAAQSDYERLRRQCLHADDQLDLSLVRFSRLGLAGLIMAPAATSPMLATLVGAARPRWSGFDDPRRQTLAEVFDWLTHAELGGSRAGRSTREGSC